MSHKCFISFKTEDIEYKEEIQKMDELDIIDKSLNDPIDSDDEDYIMRKIREDYLNDSTVTICLIGNHSAENSTSENQSYIKRELQASLYNKPNGVLGIVLPNMYDKIYKGKYTCSECGQKHNFVNINNDTTIREFNYNYYLPLSDDKCAWSESDRYCVLVKWDDFVVSPNDYIEKAFNKREDDIASKIKVYPD
ncbi:TIR domain-containing protein [Ligilactobacillus salivarius]|uniref:TIR domain-containing protein n=1 Tax=Ligilactobacillus salivarius TaxID=1624 RepID=UPI0020232E0F|nr:TIR domain-containing protein [Ligilactobacillus salivarius]URI13434.1 TIR domain-containing protein [Ligilactobacillus salivarius]UUB35271.1 TIR domain-containing protein [Ligilactobacillus salivarius]